jgi:outer membrane receptor for ferrienterochelin and colicins
LPGEAAPKGSPGKRKASFVPRHWACWCLLASAAGCVPSAGAAQVAPPAPSESTRSYIPADFARFAPRTALDMLRQVPGFIIREATQERGLGQATGNVLINGQRISGKSNDVLSELSRIPAGNVIRIEIFDGASLNIPGLSGQVANVTARASSISGQFAWRPEFRARFTKPLLTRGEVSVSGKTGPVGYTLGLQNASTRTGAGGRTYIYGPGHEFVERRYDVWTGNGERPKISGRFTYDGPGSIVGNISLSYNRLYFDYREIGLRSAPGRADRVRRVAVDEGGYGYETGADLEFPVGPGRLKLIGLNRFDHSPVLQDVVTSFADLSPDAGDRSTRVGDQKERIVRGEYRLEAGDADWQVSAEGAFNSLDNVSQLFVLGSDGAYQEIGLAGGTAKVVEDRYEVVATYGRSLSTTLRLQLSAGGEYSRLRQTGGGGLERTFWRPKGVASVAWKASPRLDLNARLQRRVGQLNFFDFLASVNLTDERENAGNPQLVPQQSWELEVGGTRSLGRYGTSSLRLYGQFIDDIVDTIPIGEFGESPGNVDHARLYGAEWKTTFNFDPVGWRGAKVDARVQVQSTSLKDPLTGRPRPISNSLMHLLDINLRQDVPGTPWAWGGNISYQRSALNYRLTEVGRVWEGPVFLSLYAEHKNVFGLTVRATVANILSATSMWDRTVYGGRRTGPIAFFERRDRTIGPQFSFSVRGQF